MASLPARAFALVELGVTSAQLDRADQARHYEQEAAALLGFLPAGVSQIELFAGLTRIESALGATDSARSRLSWIGDTDRLPAQAQAALASAHAAAGDVTSAQRIAGGIADARARSKAHLFLVRALVDAGRVDRASGVLERMPPSLAAARAASRVLVASSAPESRHRLDAFASQARAIRYAPARAVALLELAAAAGAAGLAAADGLRAEAAAAWHDADQPLLASQWWLARARWQDVTGDAGACESLARAVHVLSADASLPAAVRVMQWTRIARMAGAGKRRCGCGGIAGDGSASAGRSAPMSPPPDKRPHGPGLRQT